MRNLQSRQPQTNVDSGGRGGQQSFGGSGGRGDDRGRGGPPGEFGKAPTVSNVN